MKIKKNTVWHVIGGRLSLGIEKLPDGVALCSARDTVSTSLLLSDSVSLFELKIASLTEGKTVSSLSSLNGWEVFCQSPHNGGMKLSLAAKKPYEGIEVTITVSATPESIVFNTSLVNNSEKYALTECSYPTFAFTKNRNLYTFFPYGSGEARPVSEEFCPNENYPSYGASMPYMAMYNKVSRRGVYYGLHDPAPAFKKLQCIQKNGVDTVEFRSHMPLRNADSGFNSQSLAGSLVLKAFDGDWYDAARIYRDYSGKEARYLSDCNENGRTDMPEALKNVCHWVLGSAEGDRPFADEIIAQVKEIGVKSAVHLYNWHQIPFDNDYPHYFPMRPQVAAEVKKLQEAGILVMPYINGRLWDTRDKDAEDFEYSSLGKPNATKRPDGTPYTETYASKESDGSKVELAVMCPATTLWQDKVAEIVAELFKNGFDGVYIDQIGAASARTCYDRNHRHPVGGGEWWCESYNTMLERIARDMPKGRFLTTECTSDPFMKHLCGFLSWLWIRAYQVPAFAAAHSDRVMTFGSAFGSLRHDASAELEEEGKKGKDKVIYSRGASSRIIAAQSLIFGQQPGWISPRSFNELPQKDFYIKLVRAREKLLRFFNNGEMLRPPFITSDLPLVGGASANSRRGSIESDAVIGGLWLCKNTGEKVLLIVNVTDAEAKAKLVTELDDGVYPCITDGKEAEVEIKNSEFSLTLPPYGLAVIGKIN